MLGGCFVIGMAILYVMYGYRLCALILEQHPDMHWFVFAFKLANFVLCPVLAFLLILLGVQILFTFQGETDKCITKAKI
jgi:hypothetical protein